MRIVDKAIIFVYGYLRTINNSKGGGGGGFFSC
jgi:hypothetical protein